MSDIIIKENNDRCLYPTNPMILMVSSDDDK